MSAEDDPLSGNARLEAAATWLVRLEDAGATDADWRAFETWLEDDANRRALEAIESQVAVAEDNRDALRTPAGGGEVIAFPASRARRMRPALWAGAAAAAAAVAVGFFTLTPPPTQELAYAAPADQARVVTLPDQSSIHLNRGASVRVRWGGRERRVEMAAGEAAFRVTHDPAHPFVVITGESEIRDLGTEFNVVRATDSLTVAVRSGSVAVSRPGAAIIALTAGDRLRVDATTGAAVLARAQAEDAFAWQQGRLIYHDATLAEVVADLNRYGGPHISIADAGTAALPFTGVLAIDDPSAMLLRLEAFIPVRTERNADGVVLRSRS